MGDKLGGDGYWVPQDFKDDVKKYYIEAIDYESIMMDDLVKAKTDYVRYEEKKRNHGINYGFGLRFPFRYDNRQAEYYTEALAQVYPQLTKPEPKMDNPPIKDTLSAIGDITHGLFKLNEINSRITNEEIKRLKEENQKLITQIKDKEGIIMKQKFEYREIQFTNHNLYQENIILNETILDLINHSPIK